MANRLSDDELRKLLQEFGENVGPITGTTRLLWERRLTNLRKTYKRSPTGPSLNVLSSDDSEIENYDTNRVRKKRTVNRTSNSPARNERLNTKVTSKPEADVFKRPSPLQKPPSHAISKDTENFFHKNLNSRIKNRGKSSEAAYEIETSDSDLDSGSHHLPLRSLRLRKRLSLSETPSNSHQLLKPREPAPDGHSVGTLHLQHANHDGFRVESSRLGTDHKEAFSTNGYLTNAMSNGEFREEKVQGSSTNYSHCVSWMLVLGTVAFFIFIGALYMTEVNKTSQTVNKSYTFSKFCHRVTEDQCKQQHLVSRELRSLLSSVAGKYECGFPGISSRNLTLNQAKHFLREKLSFKESEFNSIFDKTLMLMLQNPEWGIKLTAPPNSDVDNSGVIPSNLSALEATHATKSFWCRVRLSLKWTITKLLILILVIALLFLTFFGVKFWKKRRETQEKMFYELVEKVIDILQEPQMTYQPDSNLGPCKAVVNIRDTLISPKERQEKLWIWDKVVAFIEENESRVSVEYRKIAGEDYKVWRWHPCSTPETEAGKLGKVWQGQAFTNLGKGRHSNYSPTPCLKIRNMFDPDVEYGDDWQVNVKDALLEKCEGNDAIVHIAIDTSTSEGCVYLLCNSCEAAGNAFNALHGWWFDGKLVTVKYLRYEKYLERFPEAERCNQSLKPSNNQRLSLSTPFFSSALEIS